MKPIIYKETKLDLVCIELVSIREQRNQEIKLATLFE